MPSFHGFQRVSLCWQSMLYVALVELSLLALPWTHRLLRWPRCWYLQGTQIQGTFWKDSAHKYYDSIEEGKVSKHEAATGPVAICQLALHECACWRAAHLRHIWPVWLTGRRASLSLAVPAQQRYGLAARLCGSRDKKAGHTVCRRSDLYGMTVCRAWLQVYYFTNFSVKVANKQYTSVRNDYQINFETR